MRFSVASTSASLDQPVDRDFPVQCLGRAGLNTKETTHLARAPLGNNTLADDEHNHQDITQISSTAIMSNEGPEFKNEDVKEKLEGTCDAYQSSIECILTKSQRRSSRWTW